MRCACTMVCVHHIYPPTAFVENNSQLNMLWATLEEDIHQSTTTRFVI
jgi:hypothetical protein